MINDARLAQAALAWWLPDLQRVNTTGVRAFRRAMTLSPSVLSGRMDEGQPDPSSFSNLDGALWRSAQLISEVLRGESSDEELTHNLSASDLGATIESQTRLWLYGKAKRDYEAAIAALETSELPTPLQCQIALQIALWSRLEGHRALSEALYARAAREARGHLKTVMHWHSQWFEPGNRDHIFWKGGRAEPTPEWDRVLKPWISESANEATKDALLRELRDGARAGTLIRTFGRTTIGHVDSEAAVIQAEWSGAFWLLPRVYATSAAVLLRDRDASSGLVAAGLKRYVLASGSDLGQVLRAHEKRLSDELFQELIVEDLASGDAVWDDRAWVETCTALWDQLPSRVATKAIHRLALDEAGTALDSPASFAGKEIKLLGLLGARDPQAWAARVRGLGAGWQAVALRALRESSVSDVDAEVLELALHDELRNPVEDWQEVGWDSLVAAMAQVQWPDRLALLERLPSTDAIDLADKYPNLVSPSALEDEMARWEGILEKSVEQWHNGTYAVYGRSPSLVVAHAARLLDRLPERSLRLLIDQATDRRASASQALDALLALEVIGDAGLVAADDLPREVFERRHAAVSLFDDVDTDLKLETIQRQRLSAKWRADQDTAPEELLAHCVEWAGDPSPRVRAAALRLATAAESTQYEGFTVVVLGALFDSDPRVQTSAIAAIAQESSLTSPVVDSGWRRLVARWGTLSRDVRASLAFHSGQAPASVATLLDELVAKDRSFFVREAARVGAEKSR